MKNWYAVLIEVLSTIILAIGFAVIYIWLFETFGRWVALTFLGWILFLNPENFKKDYEKK